MINVTSIPLFENLIQYKFSNIYYDFHNDYYCQKISYFDNELFIGNFRMIEEDTFI